MGVFAFDSTEAGTAVPTSLTVNVGLATVVSANAIASWTDVLPLLAVHFAPAALILPSKFSMAGTAKIFVSGTAKCLRAVCCNRHTHKVLADDSTELTLAPRLLVLHYALADQPHPLYSCRAKRHRKRSRLSLIVLRGQENTFTKYQ